ncbi:MAG TPA: hypothetical protein VG295_05875 [Solirubrobacteraceae bacterium]|nr:hypothetical protein [Solirubrobacteraceae bacterium]
MRPAQIFLSTRSRREYSRRRAVAQVAPMSVLLVVLLFAWALAAVVLWWL